MWGNRHRIALGLVLFAVACLAGAGYLARGCPRPVEVYTQQEIADNFEAGTPAQVMGAYLELKPELTRPPAARRAGSALENRAVGDPVAAGGQLPEPHRGDRGLRSGQPGSGNFSQDPVNLARKQCDMKAAFIKQTGTPENITIGEFPKPSPVDAQVLVKIEAVDVNPIDTYVRSGTVAMPLPVPYIIGCDLAGVVEASAQGPAVPRGRSGVGLEPGLLGRQGTFADYAAVDEQWLYATPPGVSSQDAVARSR